MLLIVLAIGAYVRQVVAGQIDSAPGLKRALPAAEQGAAAEPGNVVYLPVLTNAPQPKTIHASIAHNGRQREYILYIPSSYSGASPAPLILNFHAYSQDAAAQMDYGDFRAIAEIAGLLVVHPQGTRVNSASHWNIGGWFVNSTADDLGFAEALIDSLSSLYNIDPARIYSTGFSNGAYMSYLLACQLSERIAAIAPVAGSMTFQMLDACNPGHPMPVLHIHGAADVIVPYHGDRWSVTVADAIHYWNTFNNSNPVATTTSLPDIDRNDGSTVERLVYDGGDNDISSQRLNVLGGGHTWPGAALNNPGTNQDIDAATEIWNFFANYDINGRVDSDR